MDLEISTDQSSLDFDFIYNYLHGESYWAKGISPEILKRALTNSLCFGMYHKGKQMGFARVVTDRSTFGYLCDVFIELNYRGMGLSKKLLKSIFEHPELQGFRRWSLVTSDTQGLYAKFEFTELKNPEKWMEIFSPYKI
jgi:N-acetylglutamate synthase-like GNAT family acetyltransferase